MIKVKEFANKYKIALIIVTLLLVSFIIYLLANAEEDEYKNMIKAIVKPTVTIVDGTEPFDSNNNPGNDSASDNKIIRNFDDIRYDFSYTLEYKEDSELPSGVEPLEEKPASLTRDAIIDLYVPSEIDAIVEIDGQDVEKIDEVEIDSKLYNHYESTETQKNISLGEEKNAYIILSEVNGKNGNEILPIIKVREATDESDISSINLDTVTISAKEQYKVKLYPGIKTEITKNKSNQFTFGVAVYLPKDSSKGIKGIQVPSNVTFDINIDSDAGTNASIKNDISIGNYTDASIENMPASYTSEVDGNTSVNGDAGITSKNDSNTQLEVTFTNLTYDNYKLLTLSDDVTTFGLSTKKITFTNEKPTSYKNNITYTITTDVDGSNAISLLDNYKPIVGDFVSKIDFFNSAYSYDTTSPTFVDSGKAIYNYGEEFYVQNTISYGLNRGDTLPNGFTNYIKIDNEGMNLLPVENISESHLDHYCQINGASCEGNIVVEYGIGEWDPSYFKLKSDRPSYCPSSINNLSKNDLMNLYGGPCIEENDSVTWESSITNPENIIIFKYSMTNEYTPGTSTIIRLRMQAVRDHNNIGKTYQILSRAETVFDNRDYYLSQIPDNSVSNHSQDLKYEKTTYDSGYNVTGGNASYINGNSTITLGSEQNVVNFGNTIFISPFKATFNDIKLSDAYGSNKTSFYAGGTDPIEMLINPIIYKSDYNSTITKATVTVYLPIELEIYEKSGDKAYNKQLSGGTVLLNSNGLECTNGLVSIDCKAYRVYVYDYTENQIKFDSESTPGTIPALKVHAYISIDTKGTQNVKAYTKISATLKPTQSSNYYTDGTPLNQRMASTSMTLINNRKISSNGRTNVNYIDKNGTYTYNMRAANNSDSENIELLYILPYSGDGIGSSKGSNFNGKISVSISEGLPSGYSALYTTDNAKTILNNEISSTSSVNWKTWSNVTSVISPSAIKIVKNSALGTGFFGNQSGITLNLITNSNEEADKYYNNFYILQKNVDVCVEENDDETCNRQEKQTVSTSSNISLVSVYNRTISGYVFEDANFSGFYDKTESRLSDIAVDLYKLQATSFDSQNPIDAISENDELIDETTTNKNGYYEFEGLKSGNYYVKYTFDCDKYSVTEKNAEDPSSQGDASLRDSDAQIIENTVVTTDEETGEEKTSKVCYAVSNIQTLNNSAIEYNNIDLGLTIRQEFNIEMKKYINSVVVNSNSGSQTYTYKNQDKVKVDVKNLKNTSFRVTYGIEIENTKYFPGTIGEIQETIPAGMTFNPNLPENDGWYESDGVLYYAYLNKTLIMPGEKYHLTIVLDLATDNGGDYINFVAANNLKIKPIITNFFELPDAQIITTDEKEGDE